MPLNSTANPASQRTGNNKIFVPLSKFIGEPRPIEWRIRHVLPAASIIQVFGESSGGKSFLTVDWMGCITTGRDWFGYATKKTMGLYLAGEGLEGLRLRFAGWQQVHGQISDQWLHINEFPIRLNAETARRILAEVAMMPVKPGFVVVDTMSSTMDGNENDGKDVSAFLSILQRFVTESRSTVVFNHHPGHGDKTRGRGWSGIKANIDASFLVSSTDIRKGKITVEKPPKDGRPLEPLAYELSVVELPDAWTDPDYPDEPTTTCVFTLKGKAEPETRIKPLSKPAWKALEALKNSCAASPDGWTYVADWKKATITAGITTGTSDSSSRMAFERAHQELMSTNLVVSEGHKWKPSS